MDPAETVEELLSFDHDHSIAMTARRKCRIATPFSYCGDIIWSRALGLVNLRFVKGMRPRESIIRLGNNKSADAMNTHGCA